MKNRKLFGSLMLLLATLIWGLAYTVQTISSENLGTFTIVFFKGVGGLFLLPMVLMGKHKLDVETVLWGVLIGTASFVGCAFQQLGIENSTVSKAGFITSLYIIIVPLIEIIRGKKVNRKIIYSVAIATLGLYFLCFSNSESFGVGDLYLLICSLFFAIQIIFVDESTLKHDAISIAVVLQMTIALESGILMMTIEKPEMSALLASWPALIYMVFISGVIAITIQVVFQKDCGPELSSLIMSFEAVFGTIFGWLILHQTLSPREILGCILVFIAILFAEF